MDVHKLKEVCFDFRIVNSSFSMSHINKIMFNKGIKVAVFTAGCHRNMRCHDLTT